MGVNVDAARLLADHAAVLICVGATKPRGLPVPGHDAQGIHFAMDFLEPNMRSLLDKGQPTSGVLSAKDKHVVVIGGGDTGTDCVGTALRQGAKSVVNFEIVERPPATRGDENPWPMYPRIFRTDYGHEENIVLSGEDKRKFAVMTKEFLTSASGHVTGVRTVNTQWERDSHNVLLPKPVSASETIHKADMVLLAMGFVGSEHTVPAALGLSQDARSNIVTQSKYRNLHYRTSTAGVYAAGDCRRGQSLIVWAINEGRQAAREIDIDFNMGTTSLPYTGGVYQKVTCLPKYV